MTLKDLKIGDIAWMIGFASHIRPHIEASVPVLRMRVVKVGRKYIRVREVDTQDNFVGTWDGEGIEFEICDGLERGTPNYSQTRTRKLYVNILAYTKEQERGATEKKFLSLLSKSPWSCGLSKEVTTEEIRAASKLLRINLGEEN